MYICTRSANFACVKAHWSCLNTHLPEQNGWMVGGGPQSGWEGGPILFILEVSFALIVDVSMYLSVFFWFLF